MFPAGLTNAWTFTSSGTSCAAASHASDSKGNLYTTETYEGKRVQKFVHKGVGNVPAGSQGVLWPRK